MTGSGKSSLGNALLKRSSFPVGCDMESCTDETSHVQKGVWRGKDFEIIDTPGKSGSVWCYVFLRFWRFRGQRYRAHHRHRQETERSWLHPCILARSQWQWQQTFESTYRYVSHPGGNVWGMSNFLNIFHMQPISLSPIVTHSHVWGGARIKICWAGQKNM